MYELSCASCGRALAVHFAFCPGCGAAAPPLPTPADESAGTVRGTREEEAMRHVLRDIDDGHLGLWGEPGDIVVDRAVPAVLRGFDWVAELLARGWIAPARGRRLLRITDRGREAMRG